MKACVLHSIGDLRYEERAVPCPGPGEVILRVAACGVCGSDIPRVFVKGTYSFPLIPGHEMAGIVDEVGEGVDASLIGRAATVFPLIPCRRCAMCAEGEYALCSDYDYLGSRCDGGFAEYVRAPAWNVLPLPEGVSLEEGAMTEPAAVSIHALRQGGIDIGDTVVVMGTGPIGLLVAMWARAWGVAHVLLADIDPRKLEFARSLGFQNTCNPRDESLIDRVREGSKEGAHLVVEASGSAAALEQCMLAARPFGRVVLLGNPEGEMRLSQNAYWAILRRQLKVSGTWNSSYGAHQDDWRLALEFVSSGKLDLKPLITHRIGLDKLPPMLQEVRNRTLFSNKLMYVNGS